MSNATKLAAAVVVFAIIAVGGVLATRTSGTDVSHYYPLQEGMVRTYATTQVGKVSGGLEQPDVTKAGTLEQRVEGPSRLSTAALPVVAVVQRVTDESGAESRSTLHVSVSPEAVTLHAIDVGEEEGASLPEPAVLLSDPPSPNPVATEAGPLKMAMSVVSQSVEAVEVPAGSYPDALKRVSEGPVSGEVSGVPVRSGNIRETTWFAPEIGMVKQERALSYTLGAPEAGELHIEETVERVLTSLSGP